MKKILYIFILIVGLSFKGFAQNKITISAESDVKMMRFFPNPAVSNINFEFITGFDKTYTLEIFNFLGKKVYDARTATPKINIPLNDFFRGVYIYQLKDQGGKIVESGKFQVAK